MRKHQSSIINENDILLALSSTNQLIKSLPFSEIDRQKVFVSISELTRNVIMHAKGTGEFICEVNDKGVTIIVKDRGIGIKSISDVMSGIKNPNSQGLGLGLLGVKRLMDEFYIKSSEEGGTTVIVTKWINQQRRK
ncbi:ATP-binding protein [Bacillus luteolus]|uniref:ATP-binding protein n=1 Tax=Litchfieldia luteola TaxID=682179 RepID=A0ABR9QK96_9BACI|nr:ATP-binding protein [Cytobacillus luteolus]MBE4908928.1 ATP-binding protein [Cytobacillus luteolus]MBP1941787.1 serine/threonine-protein kinase RsbT [Cytobacillus luteolus]